MATWLPESDALADVFAEARRRLVMEVAADAQYTAPYTGRREFSPTVMAALGKVERHRFIPPELAPHAYENRPLPIGAGQTISQPYIVALMTDLLEPKPTDRILEIGTGSGYQAAVLAELVAQVYTMEIVEALGREAERKLAGLGYKNIRVRIGDGWQGWAEAAPFDGILVTAAPEKIPPALVTQLKAGGRMIVPVGPLWSGQELLLVQKHADGSTSTRKVLPVRFVPLVGGP
jgi:protein-L-isoaspartate(D-aspartate) O-methyltransferase